MPLRRLLILLAVATAALVAASPALAAKDRGDFAIEWGTIKPANRSTLKALRASKALPAVVREVNARWALPRDVPILVGDDLGLGPSYIRRVPLKDGTKISLIDFPGDVLTLEVGELGKLLDGVDGISPTEAMIYGNQFILAHEMGHALVDQLKLPVTGKEEDAVDGFAAYLLAGNKRFGPQTAFSAALIFDAMAALRGELKDKDFADEHSILEQRVYQFLCWIYGSDPKRFGDLVDPELLPEDRAARCGGEWRQLNTSWTRLLAPYARR